MSPSTCILLTVFLSFFFPHESFCLICCFIGRVLHWPNEYWKNQLSMLKYLFEEPLNWNRICLDWCSVWWDFSFNDFGTWFFMAGLISLLEYTSLLLCRFCVQCSIEPVPWFSSYHGKYCQRKDGMWSIQTATSDLSAAILCGYSSVLN